tara:strand:+ start:8014 stop:9651 length:1638 start_codon:yes stop_codon:yes gene_type:complete
MIKKILYFFFLNLFLNTINLNAQNTVGAITNTSNAFNGYTLFSNHKKTYLINNCGQVINNWTSNYIDGKSVYLLEDGSILRCGIIENTNFNLPGLGGVIEKVSWDGDVIWEYQYSSSNFSQHHDIYPLQNGNVLILAVTNKTNLEAFQAGRNPALLDEAALYNEQIIEVEPTGLNTGTIVWEWNIWDHLIQDYDINKDNFGIISESPQLLDINYLGVSLRASNWIHANSIQYNEDLDEIILSSRQMNEIYIIDHSTTISESASHIGGTHNKGGDFIYRWGNPIAYRQGSESDQKLFGQHTAHWIPSSYTDGGKILLYNNGNGRTPAFSTIDIINPEKDINNNYIYTSGTAYGPSLIDWQYTDSPSTDLFSRIMSSAQRLPNGNTLICDADSGYFFEVDNNNLKVWEYKNPQTTSGIIISQGDIAESNLTFRAFKYSPNYAAFTGKDLTPGLPIELNSNTNTPCNVLNIEDKVLNNLKVYPNPTSSLITFNSDKTIDKIEIYNLVGTIMNSFQNKSEIDMINYKSGVYIIKIYSGSSIINRKIIKK